MGRETDSNIIEKDLSTKVYGAILNSSVAVFSIDNYNNTYKAVKVQDEYINIFKNQGDLETLYKMIFIDNNVEDTAYNIFHDTGIFKKEKYIGRTNIEIDGKKSAFGIFLLKISESESILVLHSISSEVKSEEIELEKIDTIQERFLFSMVADLNHDTCINPNTTEINTNKQDYIDLKYSDWRMMICNMFKESDKNYFLRMTSPEYVLNNLEVEPFFKFESQMLNMTGQFIWVRFTFTRMKGFSRDNARFVFTVMDIDEDMQRLLKQNSITKAVEEQNEKLQEADKLKTIFFSKMYHEIRTPINTIMGMNEVIFRETTEDNIKAYSKDINTASKYLLSLVNDILDYSKIEAGKIEIVPVEYDVLSMIRKVYKLIARRAYDKSLKLIVDIGSDIPKRLYGDEIRITQVLINILTNAVKYTDEGSITFSIHTAETDEGKFALNFSVKDTGIGIKEEDLKFLFEEYSRFDVPKNKNVEGTGLGMSIVTGLLKSMNSELKVESTYGVGSTFSFVLPQKLISDETSVIDANASMDKEEAKKVIKDYSGKSILYIDDTELNLKVAKALLKPSKVNIDTALSGKEGLELLAKKKYNLIFLDHLMPDMDGIETLKRIKQMGGEYENIPVIALTSNSGPGVRDNYISFGFTDYLEKPIITKTLNALLELYFD